MGDLTQYLAFVREEPQGRKTPIVRVQSRSSGCLLGEIRWYGAWRQFCFYPAFGVLFNVGCMNDITAKIGELMTERRA